MSTVIKQGHSGKLLQRLVTFDLADHLAEAHSVVAAARREARAIIEGAKQENARIRAQARERGHQEGYEAGHPLGLEQGKQQALAEATERFSREHADLAASMAVVIENIERQKRDLLIDAGRDLLEFAVALASKVAHCAARQDRQAAVANVEQALRLVGNKTDLAVRINPADAQTLRDFAAELAQDVGNKRHISFVEDDSMAPGGAVVTSGGMEIDARIETQLGQIAAVLLGTESQT